MAAKKQSDSFFLRISNNKGATAGFEQEEYDLGAYVDALGKSVLRIHNIQCIIQTDTNPGKGPAASAAAGDMNVYWQLTTTSHSDWVLADDKSVVACGRLFTGKDAGNQVVIIDETANINPSTFDLGYLIATESVYLGVENDNAADADYTVTLMCECTVESMDERAAMALALSQQ